MELLFTKKPILRDIQSRSIEDFYSNCVDSSDQLNIATGFITNDSIVELNNILRYRNFDFGINLLIGMHAIDGFTELQYRSVKRLNNLLCENNAGHIYLSSHALFHGKMYSFMKGKECIGSFIGSSNLGSFVGTSNDNIEVDIVFPNKEGVFINDKILKVIDALGTDFTETPTPTSFKAPEFKIFNDYEHVTHVSEGKLENIKNGVYGPIIRIPLKAEPKSNLNTYFGAGKTKGRYSRRDYYEVEIIISKHLPNRDLIPWSNDKNKNQNCHISVVTQDGYEFECNRQGDYGKNFRSTKNLRILGRWIKGHMENAGVLTPGDLITNDMLSEFGHHHIALQKSINNLWYMWLE